MPVIDHFRHSIRTPPEQHLTHEGVRLARRVGETLPEYDQVATSEITRAIETAIAMGYGVDRFHSLLGSLLPPNDEIDWARGWASVADAVKRAGVAAQTAKSHADLMRSIADSLPDEGRALLVSHGGMIELASWACCPISITAIGALSSSAARAYV